MAYQASTQEERLRKGPWLEEEDEQLITFVTLLGERRWDSIAKASGLRRSGKSCRLRWLNYLRPNIKHGDISQEEEQIILQLHAQWGNKWSRIARMLPGRTDNEIKNYWRSHLRKKVEAQEQADFQTVRNHSEQDFLYKRGDVNGHEHQTEDSRPDEDTSETEKTCYDSQWIANFAFTSSPYETRISDWISELSSDQSEVRYSEDCSSMESLLFNPGWISDDTDTWNCSGSLWDMN